MACTRPRLLLFLALLPVLFPVSAGAHAAPVPEKIVSLNLCSDQLLLALADRGQIAGLSHNAPRPDISAAWRAARGLPVLGTSAEEVVAIAPDLILGGPGIATGPGAVLAGEHVPTLSFKPAADFAAIAANIRRAGEAVGHPDRAAALVVRMERALAALPRTGNGRTAAYYQRRGFLTGTETLVDDLFRRVGLVNLARQVGKGPLARLSLEALVAQAPDVLVLEEETRTVEDEGSAMLHHPALAAIPRIYLPRAWTVCGGPAYVDAARELARALEALPVRAAAAPASAPR